MGDTDVDTKSVSGTLHSTKRSQCQHRVYNAATLLRHEHTANRVFRRVAGLLPSGSRPEAMVVWGVARKPVPSMYYTLIRKGREVHTRAK